MQIKEEEDVETERNENFMHWKNKFRNSPLSFFTMSMPHPGSQAAIISTYSQPKRDHFYLLTLAL
jgi:hypothetical protein